MKGLENFALIANVALQRRRHLTGVVTLKRYLVRPLLACLLALTFLSAAQVSYAAPVTTVNIQGEGSFYLPCNCLVTVYLEAHAQGDAAALHGAGVNNASTGSTNRWHFMGSTNGTGVQLTGTVTGSNVWYLVGSQGAVTADEATGEITFTLGPLAGGPFRGMTFEIPISGTVNINNP